MIVEMNGAPTLREIADRAWMEHASCRGVDTERWFLPYPPKYVRRHIGRVCSSCPVTRLCLSFSLVNKEEFGVWGGFTGSELLPLRRRFASGETLSRLLNVGVAEAGSHLGSDAA